MAVRHNRCINPACSVANTGWGGGSTPARVTGLAGFPVTTGARYTTGSFMRSAAGAASPGVEYTLSMYIKPASNSSGLIYIEWTLSAGGPTYTSTGYSASAGAATRLAITATAPANTVTAGIVLDGVNYGFNTTDMTAVLIEAAAAPAGDYFDGDTPGAPLSSWDGTTGLSASTLLDAIPAEAAGFTAGPPRTSWRAGPAAVSWTAGRPRTSWTTGGPRA